MNVTVRPKAVELLVATRLIQQTSFWSRLKGQQGLLPLAFDIEVAGQPSGDLLVLLDHPSDTNRTTAASLIHPANCIAYVPFGPECLPEDDSRGLYLSRLSVALRDYLPGCLGIRWDLPWPSVYACESERFDDKGHWLGPPEARLRELRMNWGLDGAALRKAPSDILPPDTIHVCLEADEDRYQASLLARMKPKTRYNIRLAMRKGVQVRCGEQKDMPIWDSLYEQTTRRNRLRPHRKGSFDHLLSVSRHREGVKLLIAEQEGRPLAAMFLAVSGPQAYYLYGASSTEHRELMAPYALQWEAMQQARALGCDSYDLFGVAPRPDPDHPLYGLYVFKSGFGGRLLHRQGAWDFPFDESAYASYRAREAVSGSYHL